MAFLTVCVIGATAVMAATGLGKTVKGGFDQRKAKTMNKDSKERAEAATFRLNVVRSQCGTALQELGQEKLYVLNNSLRHFVDSFSKIKNVDFTDTVTVTDYKTKAIDQNSFRELQQMTTLATSMVGGAVGGVALGAATAFGAYGGAMMLGTASTGTAIASLSGAAATNATLAWFGGGALAAGGMGMAGGMAVLGGIVAGPALLTMGFIVGHRADKNLDKAVANAKQTDEYCVQMKNGTIQCIAIRRRTYVFYALLARVDTVLIPLLFSMDEIIRTAGCDYALYTPEQKTVITKAVTVAIAAKTIIDTPILMQDGALTAESGTVADSLTGEMARFEGM